MSSFRFNIATKLGVSAGLGIVLVAGMLLHQQVEFASIGRQSAAASDHQEIASRAIAAGQAVHGIQVAYRDARLADTPEQVDKALVGVQTGAAGAAKNLEAALKSIDDSGTRDRFTRSLLLIRQYSEAVTEVTTAYKDYLKTGPARTAIAQAWTKPYDELMASPALAALPNRNEVKDEITRAHVTFFDVRVAAWRWTASNEPAMIERIFKSIAATMTILDSSRRLTNDKTVLEGIDRLAKVAAPFKGLVETAAGHQTAMAQQAKAATGCAPNSTASSNRRSRPPCRAPRSARRSPPPRWCSPAGSRWSSARSSSSSCWDRPCSAPSRLPSRSAPSASC
jgi:methyl-accepting chemotaxis protein